MQDRKSIALNRIKRLFKLAEESFKKNPERSNRYIEIARKISTKIKVRIPSIYKRKFCKKCNSFLQPGINCRVRTRRNMIVYTCLNCKNISRFRLK